MRSKRAHRLTREGPGCRSRGSLFFSASPDDRRKPRKRDFFVLGRRRSPQHRAANCLARRGQAARDAIAPSCRASARRWERVGDVLDDLALRPGRIVAGTALFLPSARDCLLIFLLRGSPCLETLDRVHRASVVRARPRQVSRQASGCEVGGTCPSACRAVRPPRSRSRRRFASRRRGSSRAGSARRLRRIRGHRDAA